MDGINLDGVRKMCEDLKILDILKHSIYNAEKHKRNLSEPVGEPFILIGISVHGKDSCDLIENWLEED